MSQTTFQSIINKAIESAVDAVGTGKTAAVAVADSLEEAARKLRAGEIRIDNAVAQARAQQGQLETARSKLINDG
jgi:hypothetical protein